MMLALQSILSSITCAPYRNVLSDTTGFTDADSAQIADLALQCPFVGGRGVYKARTLYALWLQQDYNDIDICNNVGVYKGAKGLFDEENEALKNVQLKDFEQKVILHPNPTTGIVQVSYYFENGAEGVLRVLDLYGRTVTELPLEAGKTKAVFNICNHASGMYYYHVLVNGEQISSGKLLLNK